MLYASGARRRLSARLDPVRAFAHAARRHAGHPLDRLRQYRRDQRAAHRPQGPRRGDAHRRRAQGHRRRAASWLWWGRECALARRRSARSSATCSRSGSASRAAKASRPISACSSVSPGRPRSPSAASGSRCAALTRYSSLSALVASAMTPALLWLARRPAGGARSSSLLTLLLWFMHRANIARLAAGTEGKIGGDKASAA